MESKRARYKDPRIDWDNKEKVIHKKNYVILNNEEEVRKSDRELQTYQKEDLQQSCIFDPAFNIDSSSSEAGESCSSNEWINCEDDIDEIDKQSTDWADISNTQCHESTLADLIPARKNAWCDEPPGKEQTTCHLSSIILSTKENEESKECTVKYKPDGQNQTDKSFETSRETNYTSYVKNPLLNKVELYKSRIEPYFDEQFLTENPQKMVSNISKLYIGGYSKLTSLRGYISESESSLNSEDSTKRAIKSILKREGKNQMGDNPKKKVRFDLNLRPINENLGTGISQFPVDKKANGADEKLDNEMKTETKSTELDDDYKYSEDTSKERIVESNLEIYREQSQCQNYFANNACIQKSKYAKMIQRPVTISHDCEEISFDTLAIEEVVEQRLNLQKASSKSLDKKGIKHKISNVQRNPNLENTCVPLNDSRSFTSIGIQSDQLDTDTDTDSGTCSKYSESRPLSREGSNESELKSTHLEKIHTGSQTLIADGEYSFFIKDLVSSSGDKLAKFLISLSSEISSKSGDEKIENALMTVGFFREKKESPDILNIIERKPLDNDVKLEETNAGTKNRENDIDSVKNTNKNELKSNQKNERNLLINNRRSMSEINIHQLKTKEPHYNSYSEKTFHSSRLDQVIIKKKNDDSMWHSFYKNNANTNAEVMGRLCEIMTELKQNVDKICRKESTIRIENAQIWLKENKQVEKNMAGERSRNAIISEKTRETYSQTIETIDVQVGDQIQRHAVGKTEILILSNSKNDEINIKVNDKSLNNRGYMVPSKESIESNKTNEQLNEVEERKRYLEENRLLPFNLIFDNKTHLPTLKKGRYQIDIFDKMDDDVDQTTDFKIIMKKLTGNSNDNKLKSFSSCGKQQNKGRSSSPKSNTKGDDKEEKSANNLIKNFLKKLLKSRNNGPIKNSSQQFVNSQHWASTDSIFKPFFQGINREKNFNPNNDRIKRSSNIESFKIAPICSNCIESDRDRMDGYEGESWPDVIKTRYPNGMIHFGPLALMPEPPTESYERQSLKLEKCSHTKSRGCRKYIYNKHMKHRMKSSMSKAVDQYPEAEMSLEEFSETEQEFYHQWS
ncbi:putative leucine-rich repeat-containing protein DDB_G0290503 [Halyomorpha halys]|uniref:putative leucine-rich repeat-containing protein DDB_G0290503 n=1 Tax=Halyomorpha halys TaxID=286706 RepID=UPI0034D1A3B4